MLIRIGALRREDMPTLLAWRNLTPEAWRDPIPTTITRQYEWFDTMVSHSLWWAGVYDDESGAFLAQTQLYPIDWQNRYGEIGLIVDPNLRGRGIGEEIVEKTLTYGFRDLGLNMIYGEAYLSNKAWQFWDKICPDKVVMPQRKYWKGGFYNSLYFWWIGSEWEGK